MKFTTHFYSGVFVTFEFILHSFPFLIPNQRNFIDIDQFTDTDTVFVNENKNKNKEPGCQQQL